MKPLILLFTILLLLPAAAHADEVDLAKGTLSFSDTIHSIRASKKRVEITFANHPSVYTLPRSRVKLATKLRKEGKPVAVKVILKSGRVMSLSSGTR